MAEEFEKFPSFNWFPRDWIAGTATLTAEQKGIFVDLLSYAWEQTPPCTLPDDDVALAKLGGIPLARWRKIGAPVRAKLRVCEDGRLRNPKQWLVYEDMVSFRLKKQRAGRIGNAMRWQCDSNATGLGIANGIANASLPSPTPEVKKEKASLSQKKSLPDDWAPKAEHREQAAKLGVDVEFEAEKMRDWAAANGERKVKWDAAFRNWLRNAKPSGNGHSAIVSDVLELFQNGGVYLSVADTRHLAFQDLELHYPAQWARAGPQFQQIRFQSLYQVQQNPKDLRREIELQLDSIRTRNR